MTGLVHPSIDDIDCEILAELQANARIAFAELGRRVGLSTPAVIERVHRLEESQVILGYRTLVDPAQVGLPVRAFVHVTVAGDKLAKFAAVVRNLPEVLECHRVTGAESFIVQVAVRDVRHMEEVIDSMMPYVSTNTSMILASPVPWNSILPARATARSRGSGSRIRNALQLTCAGMARWLPSQWRVGLLHQ
jgi:Lrp/AsnC family leucine-responsive transcriptional regulator